MEFKYKLIPEDSESRETKSPTKVTLRLRDTGTHVIVEASLNVGVWQGLAWLAKVNAPNSQITMFYSHPTRFGFRARGGSS